MLLPLIPPFFLQLATHFKQTYLSCISVWVNFNSDQHGWFYFTFHWIYIIQTNVISFERNLVILCLSICQKIKESSSGERITMNTVSSLMKEKQREDAVTTHPAINHHSYPLIITHWSKRVKTVFCLHMYCTVYTDKQMERVKIKQTGLIKSCV